MAEAAAATDDGVCWALGDVRAGVLTSRTAVPSFEVTVRASLVGVLLRPEGRKLLPTMSRRVSSRVAPRTSDPRRYAKLHSACAAQPSLWVITTNGGQCASDRQMECRPHGRTMVIRYGDSQARFCLLLLLLLQRCAGCLMAWPRGARLRAR